MEQKDEGYFAYYAKIDKVYRKLCALEVAEYCFTPNEIVVLMFLANNPGYRSFPQHFQGAGGKIRRDTVRKGLFKSGKGLKGQETHPSVPDG